MTPPPPVWPAAERNPPIEEVIAQNVIPRFVQFLQRADVPQLQFEASAAAPAPLRSLLWCIRSMGQPLLRCSGLPSAGARCLNSNPVPRSCRRRGH